MSESYYDTAQICLNGHVINSMARDYPQSNQKFCSECGAETIMECPSCHSKIRGHYHIPGVIGGYSYEAPSYCYNCGEAYPWTKIKLQAAADLADEFDELSDDEKNKLKLSLPELIKDTPQTVVAETRFKRIMKKAGAEAYDGMKTILVDVVSETVKKSLFGV